METIIVAVDGASNIKLEVLDFHTLAPLFSAAAPTPVTENGGLKYNASGRQFAWYDSQVRLLPTELKAARVIASAARGASGGLIGGDGSLCEVPGEGLTLSYDQQYPEAVERKFAELAGGEEEFYAETGSILAYHGSLTLLKRFLYEQMERPGVLARAQGFAACGVLMAGHFLGPGHLEAVRAAGNEHSYWMCHSGARDINSAPGTPSSVCGKIQAFQRLVPRDPSVVYRPLGAMPAPQAESLGLPAGVQIIPGGHDTCLSHIPVVAALRGKLPLIHLEAGSWTMASLIGGEVALPRDGYRRGIIVQGTVDGEPVLTSMYGGGRDFSHLSGLIEQRGLEPSGLPAERLVEEIAEDSDCFVLPDINPENHGTGPFPGVEGRIVNPERFYRDRDTALVLANLCVVNTAVSQLEYIGGDKTVPVVLTGGGSRDKLFGRLLAMVSGRTVYVLRDRQGQPVSETTTLGAAMAGKAAVLGGHPHGIELDGLGLDVSRVEPFSAQLSNPLAAYRARFLELLAAEQTQ